MKITSNDNSTKKTKIGPNHHRLEVFRKYHISENIPSRRIFFFAIVVRLRIREVQVGTPVVPIRTNRRGSDLLVQSLLEPKPFDQLRADLSLINKIPTEQKQVNTTRTEGR